MIIRIRCCMNRNITRTIITIRYIVAPGLIVHFLIRGVIPVKYRCTSAIINLSTCSTGPWCGIFTFILIFNNCIILIIRPGKIYRCSVHCSSRKICWWTGDIVIPGGEPVGFIGPVQSISDVYIPGDSSVVV